MTSLLGIQIFFWLMCINRLTVFMPLMKNGAFQSKRWDLLTLFLVFISNFVVDNKKTVASEYKIKFMKNIWIIMFPINQFQLKGSYETVKYLYVHALNFLFWCTNPDSIFSMDLITLHCLVRYYSQHCAYYWSMCTLDGIL